MAAPPKFSDADLKFHWDQTGNIRETARRLKVQYSAVHERLVKGNFIQAATFNPDRGGYTSRTIPEATTLIVPDLQAPAHHPDALAFLCAIRDKFKPTNIVCIGDEVDLNWLSDFAKIPEADQPHSEWGAAQSFMRAFYAAFPEGVSCISNHVEGRIAKARTRGRLPAAFLRPVEDLLDAPIGWSWHTSIRMGDILIRHGHRDTAGLKRVIVEEIPAEHGRHLSLLIGHFHSRIGVATPDIKIGEKFYWGAFTGCLVDPRHPFFSYSKGTEKLGTVVLMHGRVVPIAMSLNEHGRWTGVL
ncbi:hypothetical protein LB553_01260 [Mesorhizobium sp. CA8]|uniref:hypothetical protein n=1 Tax=Mesorhizobium sp. CA8 TaxID=2876637 RepID=UPI001CCD6721|nr:hypothetical protein [Mesorhizobium sp. CA8]MBZ9759515.1 hypothetical protein [Mesorhizobium sp. CA8]